MRKLSMDELNRLSAEEFRAIEKLPYILILDDIRSMNSMGSVFRTADAFKAEKFISVESRQRHRTEKYKRQRWVLTKLLIGNMRLM
jgi:tRNA G18 (ribose-2'-O)-methylase SpoU